MILVDRPLDPALLSKARSYFTSLPEVAPGLITHISLHWSAMKYGWALDLAAAKSPLPYNIVADVAANGDVFLVPGMDPRNNARDIGQDERMDVTYCASCWHRNSHGVAASIAAMYDGGASNFGAFPVTESLVDALCAAAAVLCAKYGIDAADRSSCFTHAEAAIWDGYFWGDPTSDGDTRGDLCILEAHPEMSGAQLKASAPTVGAMLRERIHGYKSALMGAPSDSARRLDQPVQD